MNISASPGEFARDMTTGDYVVDASGAPVLDTSLAPPMFSRLRGHRNGWMYAPDKTWGSDFWQYNRRQSIKFTDTLGQSLATAAIQPMVDDGRADQLVVTTTASQRSGVQYQISVLDIELNTPVAVNTPVGT